jgi:hypothetical protein
MPGELAGLPTSRRNNLPYQISAVAETYRLAPIVVITFSQGKGLLSVPWWEGRWDPCPRRPAARHRVKWCDTLAIAFTRVLPVRLVDCVVGRRIGLEQLRVPR